MAAPTRRRPIPPDTPKLWVNPCGLQEHDSTDYQQVDVLTDKTVLELDKEMLSKIKLQADLAIILVEGFKHQFVKESFGIEFMRHHLEWQDQHYDWLPKLHVPKSLGIKADPTLLHNVQLDTFLRDAYTYLQVMAVALEQVEWDQGENGNQAYQDVFKTVMQRLRLVICEEYQGMLDRNVKRPPDVDRGIMSDKYRDIESETDRKLRDWIIFRDYMIVLEYIIEVSQFFLDHPDRITPSS